MERQKRGEIISKEPPNYTRLQSDDDDDDDETLILLFHGAQQTQICKSANLPPPLKTALLRAKKRRKRSTEGKGGKGGRQGR